MAIYAKMLPGAGVTAGPACRQSTKVAVADMPPAIMASTLSGFIKT